MKAMREKWDWDAWHTAALALGALLCTLVWLDTFVWHRGYAYGDETDIIARIQRIREGAPWDFSQGGIHRSLMLASMSLWPGKLWACSVPAMGAMALEGLLLFVLGRRLAGPRAGFFALLVGLASAFTLVRARSALSFALFPAEFLGLLWLRFQCSRPWQWAVWGAVLGLLSFEYEAFIPAAGLLLAAPFPSEVSWRQRRWELAGILLVLAASFDPVHLQQYFVRRKTASLVQAGAPSAGLGGLWGLVFGGLTMPYLAPMKHGVFPLWHWVLLPLGLAAFGRRAWVPLAYLGLGLVLPLMGGAPYGLPAHRGVLAWPVLALVTSLSLERALSFARSRSVRILFVAALAVVAADEVGAWAQTESWMDAGFRGPIRDLQRAALAGWAESERSGFPLVTELHPMQGAQFRFLTGRSVPTPDAGAATVVAFLNWEYLPAIRKNYGRIATFQEHAGVAPSFVAVLNGPLAQQALEAERDFRPLLIPTTQYTVASSLRVLAWLRHNPKAGPWAKTLAVDYLIKLGTYLGCLQRSWVIDAYHEKLVCAQPLVSSAEATELTDIQMALGMIRKARQLDPFNLRVWTFEMHLLTVLGREAERAALEKAMQPYAEKGLLYKD